MGGGGVKRKLLFDPYPDPPGGMVEVRCRGFPCSYIYPIPRLMCGFSRGNNRDENSDDFLMK
jgi:hypothetical protein